MSAPVLFNLLNEVGKINKVSIFSHFYAKIDKISYGSELTNHQNKKGDKDQELIQ